MPTLMELRRRFARDHHSERAAPTADESLITDDRGRLTPAQVVESKLRRLLLKPSPLDGVTASPAKSTRAS
jgi:hypothetical protein